MTNDEAVKQALDAVAKAINQRADHMIEVLRDEIADAERDMNEYAFNVYKDLRLARIGGIAWTSSIAGRAMLRYQATMVESKR